MKLNNFKTNVLAQPHVVISQDLEAYSLIIY